MSQQEEFDLLIDIARLIKKYGPEAFENLATNISKPEFSQHLVEILTKSASISRKSGISTSKDIRSQSRKDFRSSLLELEKTEPERGKILLQLYDGLITKTFLPTLMDIRNFASDNGLTLVKAKSRDKVIIPFTKIFLTMPLEELKSHIQKFEPVSLQQNDRSLEGWSKIIFGKEGQDRKE